MKHFLRKIITFLRCAAFFILPFFVIQAANAFLLRTDAHSYYTFDELTRRSDVELAIVGSSVVFANFNGELITEKTGLETYSVTANHMSLPGALAASRLMYQTNQPDYVVLVVEGDTLFGGGEDIQTQMRLSPFLLEHPLISLRYYLDSVAHDQAFIDRILLFKYFFARSLGDVEYSYNLRFHTDEFFSQTGLVGGGMQYRGRGFLRNTGDGDGHGVMRNSGIRPYYSDETPVLNAYTKRKLLEYRDLCEKNGSKLLVIISPNLTAHALRRNTYLEQNAIFRSYCLEQGIPCYDFSMAKHSFVPVLDEYYYDLFHLCGSGADLFSEKFAEFFNLYASGKPVDHLFYSSADEYLDAIDFITNVWLDQATQGDMTLFTAECMRGRTVSPEYRFSLLLEDGSWQVLQDYSPSNVFACPTGSLSGKTLRVNAIPAGKTSDDHIYYDIQL